MHFMSGWPDNVTAMRRCNVAMRSDNKIQLMDTFVRGLLDDHPTLNSKVYPMTSLFPIQPLAVRQSRSSEPRATNG
jgi:hypothetical protein